MGYWGEMVLIPMMVSSHLCAGIWWESEPLDQPPHTMWEGAVNTRQDHIYILHSVKTIHTEVLFYTPASSHIFVSYVRLLESFMDVFGLWTRNWILWYLRNKQSWCLDPIRSLFKFHLAIFWTYNSLIIYIYMLRGPSGAYIFKRISTYNYNKSNCYMNELTKQKTHLSNEHLFHLQCLCLNVISHCIHFCHPRVVTANNSAIYHIKQVTLHIPVKPKTTVTILFDKLTS